MAPLVPGPERGGAMEGVADSGQTPEHCARPQEGLESRQHQLSTIPHDEDAGPLYCYAAGYPWAYVDIDWRL